MFSKLIKKIFRGGGSDKVYADYASTTPILPEVMDEMAPFWQEQFHNPAAIYERGALVKDKLASCRLAIARLLGSRAEEIIFTGSGTESDNLAILGVFEAAKQAGEIKTPHIIATEIEHPAVMETLLEVERRGGKVTKLSVSEDGLVKVKDLAEALTPSTVLVTAIYANNEIGVIQPLKAFGRKIREYRKENSTVYPYFHTDASQAANYLDLNINSLGVDLMTLDGSKVYGPKGVGLLYCRHQVALKPIMFGGGQEQGLRPGTENLALISGLTTALQIVQKDRQIESERLKLLRDKIIRDLLTAFPKASLNGSLSQRLPNNINICFPGLDAEFAVIKLDLAGIECSFATACRTHKDESNSYVIEALGKTDCALSSLRITLGRGTTTDEIDKIIKNVSQVIKSLSQ